MNLKNKNILLVGLAKTGVSTIKLLNKLEANIIVNDIKGKSSGTPGDTTAKSIWSTF